MPRIVIVNSTPIIALSSIDSMGLLKELFGAVIIPNAVKDEIGTKSDSKAQNQLEVSSNWIQERHIKNAAQKQIFKTQLHDGEVEVMILGQELNADLLVIDDYTAREYAKYLGFNVTGTVGRVIRPLRFLERRNPQTVLVQGLRSCGGAQHVVFTIPFIRVNNRRTLSRV